ncbi:SusC/RagA family TonB-linked outer membrane protein [Longimicrobium sp.]|uniref:SusC/RagA family TonB-linked outer membrane protein n=1 Tax=Longimicrobium sp. TaxID=2029185 RepID=UPI002B7389FF|nr:SusC/RagA family TonB-linked outer membrane protein [Longimicrobium sp.]HSU13171.1 SusC/RagA family TonB-linked outer membrane protein [Longimicrobium sp.]
MSFSSRLATALGVAATVAALAAQPAAAQQTGTVSGDVTASGSNEPLSGVAVNVAGTNLSVVTNAQGHYVLRGVPARAVTVRALRIGYVEQTRSVTVPAGGTATADFRLSVSAVQLAPVVTTATGEARRVTVGNSIGQVNAARVTEERPIANISDLLTARVPGVQVLPGNSTGAGGRVRIRGTSSLSLSNDPIYVIDGIRMNSATNSSAIGVGGTTPSRVNDLNPDEIESIEVVKGPSASTLYGTDAANGVIVIRTKRGRVGRPQWSVYSEQGVVTDHNPYPTAYRAWRSGPTAATTSTSANGVQCLLIDLAAGRCTQDSVTSFNLFENDRTTPLGTGHRQLYGLQVSGGSEVLRYFVSGEAEGETGVLKIADFDVARLNRQGIDIRDEWMHPNALNRASGRANLNVTLSPKADFAINTNYIALAQRFAQTDNNTIGIQSSAYGGPGFGYNVTATGDSLFGYRAFTPGDIFQETVRQDVNRFIGSMTGNYRPATWLTARGNFGLDFTNRVDRDLCRRNNCPNFSTVRQGFKSDARTSFNVYTVDVAGTATAHPMSWLTSGTTVGAQYYRNVFDRNGAFSSNLPPGATTVTAGSVQTSDENVSEARTLGAFIEENLGINDRLFITGAVRSDRNSAFGADFKTVFYPKVSVSWVASEEPFFPHVGFMDELRLRAAYGASGVQPGTIDAVQYYAATSGRFDATELPGVVFSAVGNRNLKPERSAELETGLDARFFGNRVNTELTYYSKTSRDALIARNLPLSLGTGSTVRFENLGEVRNWGWEWLVNGQLLERSFLGWDVTVSGSHNSNELVDLGGVPPIIGSTIQNREGFPLNGYWQRPLKSFADADHNGIITVNEIVVGDTAEFMGYSQPRTEITFTNGIDLFNRKVRISALFDHKGGNLLLNGTDRIRCQSRGNCRGIVDPTAPLDEQAAAVAVRVHPSASQAGYMQDASFTRFRELGVTLTAPQSFARRFGGRALSATFSARNLKVWTSYKGIDPESNYGQTDVPTDFQTAPPPSYYTVRVNLGF